MGKNNEASLFQRFVIMLFGLGVVVIGAFPIVKNNGGIKNYLQVKFNEVKELEFKELSFKNLSASLFSGSTGSGNSGSSRAMLRGAPKSDSDELGSAHDTDPE